MIYCFDLDNTLCTTEGSNYSQSIPIVNRISQVNKLYDEGHTIIIDTARGSLSGRNHFEYTVEQLKSWGLKFHHLRAGVKFNADFYIDDKGTSDKQFFGDFRFEESGSGLSTKIFSVERVRKEAVNDRVTKLVDEYRFINSIPAKFANSFPRIVSFGDFDGASFYEMEHFDIPSLRRLIFSGRLTQFEALDLIRRVTILNKELLEYEQVPYFPRYLDEMHWGRFESRMKELREKAPVFVDILDKPTIQINGETFHSPNTVIKKLKTIAQDFAPPVLGRYAHADLHFSNILYSRESDRVILIDPRGYPYCDLYYDLGKIWHSLNGKYEMIASGLWTRHGLEVELEKNSVHDFLDSLKDGFKELVGEVGYFQSDNDFKLVEFNEAIHFLCLVPFQLRFDGVESKAMVAYLTGVRLINCFWEKYYG
jgi:hypothetical protein